MDKSTVVASLIGIAERVVPLLAYGETGMKLAQVLFDGMKDVSETVGLSREDTVALDAGREALERAVNEHAKRTAAKLGDG